MSTLDAAPTLRAQSVDLLLFQIGDETYAADAVQVSRIARPQEGALALAALGPLRSGGRALVFQTEEGEGQLLVDVVLGVKSAPVSSLRRLPGAARSLPYTIGMFLDADRSVLLIDLASTPLSQDKAPQAQGR